MLCPQEDYSCLWSATPTSGDDQNSLTYQLQIQPLADEGAEPADEDYCGIEHTFDISNMKVRAWVILGGLRTCDCARNIYYIILTDCTVWIIHCTCI